MHCLKDRLFLLYAMSGQIYYCVFCNALANHALRMKYVSYYLSIQKLCKSAKVVYKSAFDTQIMLSYSTLYTRYEILSVPSPPSDSRLHPLRYR